tara:strand:+ start:554 stop:1738 length:1185 start_codon:yes stop_codon:yes gene_type:complete
MKTPLFFVVGLFSVFVSAADQPALIDCEQWIHNYNRNQGPKLPVAVVLPLKYCKESPENLIKNLSTDYVSRQDFWISLDGVTSRSQFNTKEGLSKSSQQTIGTMATGGLSYQIIMPHFSFNSKTSLSLGAGGVLNSPIQLQDSNALIIDRGKRAPTVLFKLDNQFDTLGTFLNHRIGIGTSFIGMNVRTNVNHPGTSVQMNLIGAKARLIIIDRKRIQMGVEGAFKSALIVNPSLSDRQAEIYFQDAEKNQSTDGHELTGALLASHFFITAEGFAFRHIVNFHYEDMALASNGDADQEDKSEPSLRPSLGRGTFWNTSMDWKIMPSHRTLNTFNYKGRWVPFVSFYGNAGQTFSDVRQTGIKGYTEDGALKNSVGVRNITFGINVGLHISNGFR